MSFARKIYNKFTLLLRKGVYPYGYKDRWESEVTLYYLLMFSRILEKKCIEINELDPAHFLSAPGLAWRACLKMTEVKLQLLTDVNMSLLVEKRIRGGICHAIHRYAKANNKYMKNYDNTLYIHNIIIHSIFFFNWDLPHARLNSH